MSLIVQASNGVKQSSDFERPYLKTTNRPPQIEKRISIVFDACLYGRCVSGWGTHGEERYTLLGIDEQKLVKNLVQNSSGGRKDFYVLDLGGGDFSWSRSLARFIDAQKDLPTDIKVHIIGTRAEKDTTPDWDDISVLMRNPFAARPKKESTPKIENTRYCTVYNLEAIRAEHLSEDLQREGLDLVNKIDLVVSKMCFRHLVDPVGTFVDTFNLLRPTTGLLLSDGFVFALEGQPNFERTYHEVPVTTKNLMGMLVDMNVPFLTNLKGDSYPCQIMVQRPNEQSCRLPMEYTGRIREARDCEIASHVVTEFRRLTASEGEDPHPVSDRLVVQGNMKLYDWVRQQGLFRSSRAVWHPILQRDAPHLPLLTAICDRNQEEVNRLLLDSQTQLNEVDGRGRTAYHFAIFYNDVKTVQSLLERGSDFERSTKHGETPLHYAAGFDKTGEITSLLLHAKAQVNSLSARLCSDILSMSPLDTSIDHDNRVVIERLIKAGGRICKTTAEKFIKSTAALLQDGNISAQELEMAKVPLEEKFDF